MSRKTLTAAVAALTLTGAVAVSSQPAQAGGLGRAVAIGAAGFAVGALAAGAYAAPAYGYARPVYYGYGCGTVARPVFDAWGHQVGWRRVPAC